MASSSTPGLSEFDPRIIPGQYRVIRDIRQKFNYDNGKRHEVLMSGSVGSAKSIVIAHLAVTHCLMNPGARFLLGRRTMPDLKSSIYTKIIEHLADQNPRLYSANDSRAYIKFANGSEIVPGYWADKRYKRFRSREISAAAVEELTENDDQDQEAYHEIKMRVGRLPHVKESFIISATNPDSPAHWAYDYFIKGQSETRHVYYSKTADNPFLPPEYLRGLERDLDPKLARRMLYGEWIDISAEGIYYSYSSEKNYRDTTYEPVPGHPIGWAWDFNIGLGKPMSTCFFQYVGGEFHFFDEIVLEGARTENVLEEAWNRHVLRPGFEYFIFGDATGKARSTASKLNNYELINEWLRLKKFPDGRIVRFTQKVPMENPPIRERHNIVNAYCQNMQNQARLFVYKQCPTLDKGFRLTKLRKGASYLEDDTAWHQHVTTAAGYGIVYCHRNSSGGGSGVRMLPR